MIIVTYSIKQLFILSRIVLRRSTDSRLLRRMCRDFLFRGLLLELTYLYILMLFSGYTDLGIDCVLILLLITLNRSLWKQNTPNVE